MGTSSALATAEIYDPATGMWSPTGSMQTARGAHSATLLDGPACRTSATLPAWCGRVVVAGGGGNSGTEPAHDTAEIYDPATGTWSPAGKLPNARGVDGEAGEIVAGAGELASDAGGPTSGPANALANAGRGIADSGGARLGHTAALLDGPRCRGAGGLPLATPGWCGKVLIAGGVTVRDPSLYPALSSSALYDPDTNSWSPTGSMSLPRVHHSLSVIDGGPCHDPTLSVALVYCGRVLVAGGTPIFFQVMDGSATAEFYDPDRGLWVPTGPMTDSRYTHAATVLDGPACRQVVIAPWCNKVLVSGGFTPRQYANTIFTETSAELYDPLSGTWAAAGTMLSAWAGHTLTTLDGPACRISEPAPHCGKVLVSGSSDPLVSTTGGAPEIYDPAAGTFLPTAKNVTGPRDKALLLDGPTCRRSDPAIACGRVFAYGSPGGGLAPTVESGATAELFDGSALSQPPTVVSLDPPSGPSYGGAEIVLVGAGFEDVMEVIFGDRPALGFTVKSSTQIVARNPAQPDGVVDVTVITSIGTSAAIKDSRFTVFTPTHQWTPTGSRVVPVDRTAAAGLPDGRVMVTGGRESGDFRATSNSVEVFDPASGRWDEASPLLHKRRDHTLTRLADGRILAAGGIGFPCCAALTSAELYDPVTGTWTQTGSLIEPRAWHTATLLPSGKVLAVGGATVGNTVNVESLGAEIRATAEIFDPTTGLWSVAGQLTTKRWKHHAALLPGGRVLIASGIEGCCKPVQSAEIYDPVTGFQLTAPLASPREHHTMTSLPGGRVLVAGGCAQSNLCGTAAQPDPEIYENGVWRTVPGMPSVRSSHTASVLSGPACAELCGKVVFAGGAGVGEKTLSTVDVFDPVTEQWHPTAGMGVGRSGHQSAVLNDGRLLALGGASGSTGFVSAEILGPIAGTGAPVVNTVEPPAGPPGMAVRIIGSGLASATRVSFGGVEVTPTQVAEHVVVATSPPQARGRVEIRVTTPLGTSPNDPLKRTDDFTYAAGRWRTASHMSALRYLHSSTVLDGPSCRGTAAPAYCGRVLVAGGTTNFLVVNIGSTPAVPHRSAEVFDPASGTWAGTGDMTTPRFNHTATLLDGPECHGALPLPHCGKVLVVGGSLLGGVAVADAELYDPLTGTWTPTGSTTQPRFSHTATVLADGRVLFAGGSDTEATRRGLDSVEIYNPLTGVFTPVASLASERNEHTATLLPGGKVLVAGGLTAEVIGSDSPTLASAEIYDPAANTWTAAGSMGTARFSHSASLLSGSRCGDRCGKVLVAGGVLTTGAGNATTFTPSTELFDPATGEWSPAGSLGTARAGHKASSLENGTVLVTGGAMTFPVDDRPPPVVTAEVYDPVASVWAFTHSARAPRGIHGASVLEGPACRGPLPPAYCGNVLVSGGATVGSAADSPFAPQPLASSEIYVPAPDVASVSPVAGAAIGGAEVTVDGAGFSGATSVRFGDVPATSFQVHSPTRITAVAPPATTPGPVEVIVDGPGGTSALQEGNALARFTYLGLPGAVSGLVARALSDTSVELSFAAAHNGDGSTPAQDYQIRRGPVPFTEATFDTSGFALCGGTCHFDTAAASYTVRVDGLTPGTAYHFGVRATNPYGRGPLVAGAVALTSGTAPLPPSLCPSPPPAQSSVVAYPAGQYRLVGLPGGTVVGSDSPLYGWFDVGAGGSYSVHDRSSPVTAGRGYWAWFACDRHIDVTAAVAAGAGATMPLGAYHASMVGNPSTSTATVSGHDFAARWNPSLNGGAGGYEISGYQQPQTLAVGEGAWTFSYVPTEIRVNGRG